MPYIGNITQDFNVSNAMLDTDSVTSIKIVDGTIEGADLAANLDLSDTQKIRFGTGNDLEIYHNGTNSFIENSTGSLYIRDTSGGDVRIQGKSGEDSIICHDDGAVELYYDNTKRLETDTSGVKLSNGRFYSAGTFAFIESSDTSTATLTLKKSASGADSIDYLQCRDSSNNIKLVISGSGDVDIEDNTKLKLGAGDDLQIYHNGNNSFIVDNGTGNLYIRGDDTLFIQSASGEDKLKATTNGSIELYYDNSKKFETTSTGAKISGTLLDINTTSANPAIVKLQTNVNTCEIEGRVVGGENHFILSSNNSADSLKITGAADGTVQLPNDNQKLRIGAGQDLDLFHDGTNSVIKNNTGTFFIAGDIVSLTNAAVSETYVKGTNNGAVELYYDNVKKLETASHGVSIAGNLDFPDNTSGNASLRFGNSQDFFMNHNGSDSYIINNTGDLYIRDLNGDVHIQGKDSEESIIAKADGAVELYYNNGKRFETSSDGATFSGSVLFPDNQRIKVGGDASNPDLQIYHDGSNTRIIEGGTGHLYVDTSSFIIRNAAGSETLAQFVQDGGVELYHNNVKRITTRSGGGAQDGAVIYGNSSNVAINLFTDTSERGTVYANSSNQVGFLDSGGDWAIKHTNDSQTEFYVQTNRKAAIDADGLKFNNDTAAANALDDYEEGTYTATLTPATSGSVTLSSSHETLKYTKVGRLVALTGRVNIASISSPQGALRINLPFTNATEGADHSAYTNCSVFSHEINTVDNTIGMMVEISPGNSHGTIFQVRDAVSWSGLDGNQLTSSSSQWLTFTIHFFTNT